MEKLLKESKFFKNEVFVYLKKLPNQGFCNTNYVLKTTKQTYLIRFFKTKNNIDRKFEFQISFEAYKQAIGAEPLFFDEKNSLMIYEFLEGKHKYRLKKQEIIKVALLLRKLHSIKIDQKLSYLKKDFVLCHHDLNPKNFIFSKNLKLIDWEYARFDDPYFDLATVIVEFNLNKKNEKLFLNSYFKNNSIINRKKVYFFKIQYITLCINWFKKQNNQKELIKYKKINYEQKFTNRFQLS